MGLRTVWVRYGREAATSLRQALSACKAGDPLAPVTVVVPSNSVGVAARRLIASGDVGPVCDRGVGLAAVTFVTPYRLAELLGASSLAATGRRPVSTPLLTAAVRKALSEDAGMLAAVAGHAATEGALVAAYRELRDLSDAALDGLASAGGRAAEVVRLHRSVRAALQQRWYDEEDLMVAAAEVLDVGPASVKAPRATRATPVADLGEVVIHLPQRLSRHAALLLRAGGRRGEVVVLAGSVGERAADADVMASLDRLGLASVPPTAPDAVGLPDVVAFGRTTLVTASDADDEVRAAVRTVVNAVRAGLPLDRVAILHTSPSPYARLLHEHLAAAGIPLNGSAIMPVASRVSGRALLQLLALPEADFRRQDVFAWLSAAPVRFDGGEAPVSAWERLSRIAGVVSGRGDWDGRLALLAENLERRAATRGEPDPDPQGESAEAIRRDAARARALRTFVLGLIDDLATAAAQPRPWHEHASWARGALDRLVGGAALMAAWSAAERKAAERVDLALGRLAALTEVEGPVGLDAFTCTLELELESDLGRVGRFGDGVLVGSVSMGVGLDLDLVVVLGLAEGTFPAAVHDDSLLPDHERSAALGELGLRAHRVNRDHRDLLASLAGATSQVLCVPRGDLRRSSQRVASRWALDAASQLAGRRWWSADLFSADVPWVRHVASFAAGVEALDFPATEQEHRLRSLLAAGASIAALPHDPSIDRLVAKGVEVLSARRSGRFTRFDGHLDGLAVPSPVETGTTATRLQRWAECPFAYFVHDVLGAREVINPEEALSITPLDKGNLVHEILERFVTEILHRPQLDQPAFDVAWTENDRARLGMIAAEVSWGYVERGLTGRPILWRHERAAILRDLDRTLGMDDRHRRIRRMRPVAAELHFGLPGSNDPAVPLELPDGRVLRLAGSADRLDEGHDGGLHVIDYKSGSADALVTGLSETNPDQRGRRLQLPVYGIAARAHRNSPGAAVRAEYWHVSTRGKFKTFGYEVTDDVLDRVRATVGTLVDGIEAGVFPSHPTAVSSSPRVPCASCDPDSLGVTELRRAWERKRDDPALARYADFSEPPEADGDEAEDADGA